MSMDEAFCPSPEPGGEGKLSLEESIGSIPDGDGAFCPSPWERPLSLECLLCFVVFPMVTENFPVEETNIDIVP